MGDSWFLIVDSTDFVSIDLIQQANLEFSKWMHFVPIYLKHISFIQEFFVWKSDKKRLKELLLQQDVICFHNFNVKCFYFNMFVKDCIILLPFKISKKEKKKNKVVKLATIDLWLSLIRSMSLCVNSLNGQIKRPLLY